MLIRWSVGLTATVTAKYDILSISKYATKEVFRHFKYD